MMHKYEIAKEVECAERDIAARIAELMRRTGKTIYFCEVGLDVRHGHTRDGRSFVESEEVLVKLHTKPVPKHMVDVNPKPSPRWAEVEEREEGEAPTVFNWNAVVRVWIFAGLAHVTFANDQTIKVTVKRAKELLPEFPWGEV